MNLILYLSINSVTLIKVMACNHSSHCCWNLTSHISSVFKVRVHSEDVGSVFL